ncbi:hypothetical protein SISNIDRAFT_450972 [Sistotremastrum niveocremeum HHB9708]|uniref:WW domain-containing protein n=1 Tax=Sistotremastrum niveocremeum HHB9708 TaxID=1314777 RepID=A0A164XUJ4_9AGAM|nr:hypothetical protein SISNIDRAFT_450972 [Sistotremastrum niveocremeum HHB9708]
MASTSERDHLLDQELAPPPDPQLDYGTMDDPPPPGPPPYSESESLRRTTAVQSRRYQKGLLEALPEHRPISIGLFAISDSDIPPPPEGWLEFVHPEGQTYFYHPEARIVTEANLRIPAHVGSITFWANQVHSLVAAHGIELQESTELMLELDEDGLSCRYYFVDHVHRVEFWIDDTNTEELDIPPVTSTGHLKNVLQQHYWNHVEYFPMHISLPPSVEEELVASLTHGCIDFMTSNLTTFPYTADECQTFIKLFQTSYDSPRAKGYKNCVIARLWSELLSNYFLNLHGEPLARLSRTQQLLPDPDIQNPWYIRVIFTMFFDTPAQYLQTLRDLWVDEITYSSPWRKFITDMLQEWKNLASWAAVLLITALTSLSILILWTSSLSSFLTNLEQMTMIAAVLFSFASLASSVVLIHIHKFQKSSHAYDAAQYFRHAFHDSLGFQPLAIIFAMPWASFMWALISVAACVFLVSLRFSSVITQLIIWCLEIAVCVSIYAILQFFGKLKYLSDFELDMAIGAVRDFISTPWRVFRRRRRRAATISLPRHITSPRLSPRLSPPDDAV